MIGNDIVDLEQSRFSIQLRFHRYAKKICTEDELVQLGVFEEQERSLWRLWSLKESTYKAAYRMGLTESFSPQAIKVKLCDAENASISFGNTVFSGSSTIEPDFIYSEVSLTGRPLKKVRKVLKIEKAKGLKSNILKEGKLPFYFNDGQRNIASITHHGRYYGLLYINS